MPLTLTPEISSDAAEEAYRFHLEVESGTYHQWPFWTTLNPPDDRQEYLHFRQEDGTGRTVTAGLMRFTRIVPGLYFAAIQRGPATASVEDLPAVLQDLEDAAHAKGAVNLTINPYWLGDAEERCVAQLESLGYSPVPRELQNMPTTTAVIDLTREESEIFAQFKNSVRTAVRKADKMGVEILPVKSEDEAREISEIMVKMASHRGMAIDSQFDLERHFRFLQHHPEAGVMLRSEYQGTTLGGVLAYREGARAGHHVMASDPEADRKIPRNHGITWALMRVMRDLGCTEFDMIGYPDVRYETPEDARRRGAFKAGFNPATPRVPPLMVKPLRPLVSSVAVGIRAAVRSARKRRSRRVSGSVSPRSEQASGSSHGDRATPATPLRRTIGGNRGVPIRFMARGRRGPDSSQQDRPISKRVNYRRLVLVMDFGRRELGCANVCAG